MKEEREMIQEIQIKGARQNNLKNFDINIPKDMLTVVTGVSGSGKSSLVFDLLYSEGQRRFLSSLDTYARSFTSMMKKPDVDFVFGLSPVLSVSQKKGIHNPRSTVGTLTDISDYMRLLYSSIATAQCPYCESTSSVKSNSQIAEHICTLPKGTVVEIFAPVIPLFGESYAYFLREIRKKGIRRMRIDGDIVDISKKIKLEDENKYSFEVLVDSFCVSDNIYKQLTNSLEHGFMIGEGFLCIDIAGENVTEKIRDDFYSFFCCVEHHVIVGQLLPYYFTPNESDSACYTCKGTGVYRIAKPWLVVDNWKKSIRKGALTNTFLSVKHPGKYMLLYSLAEHYGFDLDTSFEELPQEAQDVIFYGTAGKKIKMIKPPDVKKSIPDEGKMKSYEGILNQLNTSYRHASKNGESEYAADFIFKKHMAQTVCPECKGVKLKPQRKLIKINGKNIHDLGEMPIDELLEFMKNIELNEQQKQVGSQILKEIVDRLELLVSVGVEYINLNRTCDTLSGGELQRIRLTTQLSSGLSGMIYILDEPSIGLHSKDSNKIINTLRHLQQAGNTVIVVEHDADTILNADHVIEIGPGPGEYGGEVVFQGDLKSMLKSTTSITGAYLSGRSEIPIPRERRKSSIGTLKIVGARENNLKNIDVEIPLGIFVCVTGVSGSGKSSLINEILYKKLRHIMSDPRITPGKHDFLEGHEKISNVINIDQKPIGNNARSNPATYVGFFNRIRELFAQQEESLRRGYDHTYFSSNNMYGRCDECAGNGMIRTELKFMPDVVTRCKACSGTGFSAEVREIQYRGKNIAEILNLSVEAAIDFFSDYPYILNKLKVMDELGLGYLRLGQSSSTLSGGEAQRIKLATELSKVKRGAHNLYILDEPTTGLHMADIQRLLDCLNKLVDLGHTVLVVEHNLEIVKSADYIIDIGPGAGKHGGLLVAQGTPEQVSQISGSYTGQFLKKKIFKE